MLLFITSLATFTLLDYFLKYIQIKGEYYIVHSLTNLIVMRYTFNNFIKAYYEFNQLYHTNYQVAQVIAALHIYHIIVYYKKLRFDDWLHHYIMILLALPLSTFCKSGNLFGHGLFFINGLPGCIDYMLLSLVRNNIIDKMTEKRYNKYLNIWIRAPGCISNITLTIVYAFINYNYLTFIDKISCVLVALCVYWNGIYFMEQIITDYCNQQKYIK